MRPRLFRALPIGKHYQMGLQDPDGGVLVIEVPDGGFGTRLSEETELRPKLMAEIGAPPILWRIVGRQLRI